MQFWISYSPDKTMEECLNSEIMTLLWKLVLLFIAVDSLYGTTVGPKHENWKILHLPCHPLICITLLFFISLFKTVNKETVFNIWAKHSRGLGHAPYVLRTIQSTAHTAQTEDKLDTWFQTELISQCTFMFVWWN